MNRLFTEHPNLFNKKTREAYQDEADVKAAYRIIGDSPESVNALCKAMGRSYSTVRNWIRDFRIPLAKKDRDAIITFAKEKRK